MSVDKKRPYDSSEAEDEVDRSIEVEKQRHAPPTQVARSRFGRRIKPKKWSEGEESATPLVEEKVVGQEDTDSYSNDHYSPEVYLPEPLFAVPVPKAKRSTSPSELPESVPVRDQAGRFAGARQHAVGDKVVTSDSMSSRGGGIFKTAAINVLRQEKRLMSTGEISKVAMKQGYVNVTGKTPEATMASALYTDIKRKEGRSVFIRPHEGLFGLREWHNMGYKFKDPLERVMEEQPQDSIPVQLVKPSSTQRRSGRVVGEARTKTGRPATRGPAKLVTTARSWSEPADSGLPRARYRAGKPSTRQYSSNLDILFAAVDEVSGAEMSEEKVEQAFSAAELEENGLDIGKAESATIETRTPAAATNAVANAVPQATGMESVEKPDVLNLVAQIAFSTSNDYVLRLIQIHRLETALKALEDQYGADDQRLGQVHLQLFKLYQEAGLQDKAHDSLQRACEISEATYVEGGQ